MADETWSFSLRGGCGYAEDEDSMEAADSAYGVDQMTDETLVDAEVDLSSREDSAHFESNPWTIAKLNAFNRARTFSKFKPTLPHPTPGILVKRLDVSDPQSHPANAKMVKLEHKAPICDLELVRTTPSPSREHPKVTTSASSGTMHGCSDENKLPRGFAHKDDEPPASYPLQLEGPPLPKRARLPTYSDAEKISEGSRSALPRKGPTRIPKVSSPLEAQSLLVFGAEASQPIHQKSLHAPATITDGLPASPCLELQSRNASRPTRGWKSRTISTTPKTQNTSPTAGSQAEYGISKSQPTRWNCVNSLATPDRRQGSSVSQIPSLSPSKPTRTSFHQGTESHTPDVSVVDESGALGDAMSTTDLPSTPAATTLHGRPIIRPSRHPDFGDDESQLWSTLPRKRKRADPPETPDPYRSGGTFRLPNLPFNLTPASPMSPRVILYRPPPGPSTSDHLATTPKWTFYRTTGGTGFHE